MASEIVVIRPETHKKTKIKTSGNLGFTEKMNIVPVVMPEFASIAANSPVVLVRDSESSRFMAATMLGLENEENLFYADKMWQGTHVPMNIGRIPFTLKRVDDTNNVSPALDMGHELVNEEEGEPLIGEDGKETDYFKRVNQFLGNLFEGEVAAQKFVRAMEENKLLREFKILIEDAEGKVRELTGLWTPVLSEIQKLPDEKVLELHKEGFLPAAYIMIQSMSQVTRLVKMKNDQAGKIVIRAVRIEVNDPDAKKSVVANSN